MSREEEKFDRFLKQKLENVHPEFSETYWHRAQLLLRQQGTETKNPWLFRGILLLFAVLLPVFWFVNTNLHGSATDNTLNLNKFHEENLPQSSINPLLLNKASFNKPNTNQVTRTQYRIAENKAKLNLTLKDLPSTSDNAIENSNHTELNKFMEEPKDILSVNEVDAPSESENEQENNRQLIKDVVNIAPRFSPPTKFSGLICDTCNPVRVRFHKDFDQSAFRSFVGVEACLTYYNSKLFDPNSIQYGFGVSYYYFYKRKLGIAAGLHYTRLNQSLDPRTYSSSDFDFGSHNQVQTYQTCRLDYLQVPLSFLYRTNGKNMFDAGVNLLWLVQSMDKVETTKTGEVSSQTTTYEKGFTESIHPFDIHLSLGYTRMLSNNFYMQAKASLGLLDVSVDEVMKSNTIDKNKGFKIGLGYKIN